MISFICMEFPSPTLKPHWLQFGTRIMQSHFHTEKRGSHENAGVFICLNSQCCDGKADKEVRKTSSKQYKQFPRKWLNKAGGGGAKAKSGHSQQRPRDTSSSLRCCSGQGRDRGKISAANLTQTFSSQAALLPFLLRISPFYMASQTSAQRRRVSS